MAIRNGKLERLMKVPTGGWTFSLDVGAGNVTANIIAGLQAFLSSGYDGGDSFITLFDTILTTIGGSPFTVTIGAGENGTGKVTITKGSGNFNITWVSTDLRDMLGFTQGNLTGANSYTGASQAKGLWLPNSPGNSMYGAADKGFYETDTVATESPSGNVKAFFANKKQVNVISWRGITFAKCRVSAEVTANESYEQFWLDCILGEKSWAAGPCGPVRVYWDAGDDSVYADYKVVGDAMRSFMPEPLEEGWLGLWNIELDRMVVI